LLRPLCCTSLVASEKLERGGETYSHRQDDAVSVRKLLLQWTAQPQNNHAGPASVYSFNECLIFRVGQRTE